MPKTTKTIKINPQKLTQLQLSSLIGISTAAIRKWEDIPRNPTDKSYNMHQLWDWQGKNRNEHNTSQERRDEELKKLQNQNTKLELEIAKLEKRVISKDDFETIQKRQAHELMDFLTDGYKRNSTQMMRELKIPGNRLKLFQKAMDSFIKQAMDAFVKSGERI